MVWSIRELCVGSFLSFRRLKIQHEIRVESTRRKFAECRIFICELALQGQMDFQSITFSELYGITTSIMRRPDRYPEISRMFRNAIMNHPQNRIILEESKNWNPETKCAVKKIADAMNALVIDYSSLMRFLYWLEYHLKALIIARAFFEWIIRKAEKPRFFRDPRHAR